MGIKKNNEVGGFLKGVERIGNKLPHPAMIFLLLSIAVVIISAFAAAFGKPVTYFDARQGKEVTIGAVSLLNADGFRYILNSATKNFMGFAPLGTVLVAMLGVGVAEWTGLINTSLKKLLSNVHPRILTAVVVFAGVMSNIASDAGYVVVIPLGAIVFANAGRHPMAGLAAAFAGVSGGFSANLILGTTDPLLTGITVEALHNAGMDIPLDPTCNWFFMAASTVLLTIVGTFVTEKIVEKNLGTYTGSYKPDNEPVSETENKGLKLAGISILILTVVLIIGMFGLPKLPFLAILQEVDAKTGQNSLSNFMHGGLLPVILILFLVPGLVYGKKTGKINNSHDVVKGMTVAMSSMGGYLVLSFFAAQFVNYFGKTNLGTIISVNGANFLQSIGFTGLPLIISFVIISAFLNLFMGSASAKWAIMAPIFVPMMVNLGLSPALTQVAYRIGDSSTNLITPLMNYFAMIVVFMKKYDEDSGLGTLISTMLPYSIAFLLSWIVLMIVWYVLGIPLGPGAYIGI
ncbi:AbgT family transporter [Treponema pedis]|uniref:AbgT family transporter n=1 Tax=Treponema pedis TaxID=409322 RepID=A0A7S7AVB8_9SPIR|nr:AbgT family transporter [Treponema pedis]QOW60035.1 AbgT family transporter [Treponema pedis]QSI05378.1 AbgT family transporter [Treponema pedis]